VCGVGREGGGGGEQHAGCRVCVCVCVNMYISLDCNQVISWTALGLALLRARCVCARCCRQAGVLRFGVWGLTYHRA
jgi:hypothetical protein